MQKKTKGILIYSKISKENNLFIKFLSEDDEIISGIVYGGYSSKNKILYQLGYFLNFIIIKKNDNSPYSIKGEITSPYISSIINDKYKLSCLIAIVSILNLSLIEGQKIKGIYFESKQIIDLIITKKNWLILFIKFLFNLLRIIGYEVDYKNNSHNSFFDLESIEFKEHQNNNTLIFPHKLLNNEEKVKFNSVKQAFLLFEEIFQNNHLINMNLKLPVSFINFKYLILEFLKNKND